MSIELNKKIRVNESGHVLIYKPDHPTSYKSKNWGGYVYEHRYIAEIQLGRSLLPDEVVHHLDDNPANNEWENLLVISDLMHRRLHTWLSKSAFRNESAKMNGVNSGNSSPTQHRCLTCEVTLTRHQNKFCGISCHGKYKQRSSRKPSYEQLVADLKSMNYCAVGRKYGVSDNAIRKWERSYVGNRQTILSQAVDTSTEGATTT